MLLAVTPDSFIPDDHPIRRIKPIVESALVRLSPLFNEMYVAPRLIEAVCKLDYPGDRLQIQVLDDSTDETVQIAAETVEAARRRGVDPSLLTTAETLLAELETLALGCYHALGCRDIARVDLRLKAGVPQFIEVNPLPGLSPTYGDLPILAGRMGWTHRELVLAIVQHALERSGQGLPRCCADHGSAAQ